MNIKDQVNRLQRLATAELAAQYEDLFGRKPRSRSPAWLRKRIAYRLQENAYGGLSAPARAMIERLAAEIEIPGVAAQGPVCRSVAKKTSGLPKPGTVLQREWRGQQIRVQVLEDGVEWDRATVSVPLVPSPGRSPGPGGTAGSFLA